MHVALRLTYRPLRPPRIALEVQVHRHAAQRSLHSIVVHHFISFYSLPCSIPSPPPSLLPRPPSTACPACLPPWATCQPWNSCEWPSTDSHTCQPRSAASTGWRGSPWRATPRAPRLQRGRWSLWAWRRWRWAHCWVTGRQVGGWEREREREREGNSRLYKAHHINKPHIDIGALLVLAYVVHSTHYP